MKTSDKARLSFWLYAGAVVIFIIYILSVGLSVSANPSICAACHSNSRVVKAWEKSSHSKITCAACHVRRGFEGVFSPNIWHFMLAALPGGTSADNAELNDNGWSTVTPDRCRRCHSPENRSFTVRRGLRMDHQKHVENNVSCITCHNRVAHPLAATQVDKNSRRREDRLSMTKGCWRCHGKSDLWREPRLLATLPATANPPTDCRTCHTELWTMRPTKGRLNHDDAGGIPWRVGTLRHGKVAKATNFALCFGCHDRQAWCGDKCHSGIAMPHNIPKYGGRFASTGEPEWRGVHFDVAAKKSREPCRLCHDSKWLTKRNPDFCMTCHHKDYYQRYPQLGQPWVKAAMPFVKDHGADGCWKCHQPEFCVTCHSTGKKPLPGTTFVRRAKAR